MAASSSSNVIPDGTYFIKKVEHSVEGDENIETVKFDKPDIMQGLHVPAGRYYPGDEVRVKNDAIVEKVGHARDRSREPEQTR